MTSVNVLLVFRHPVAAHSHKARKHFSHFFFNAGLIHPQGIRNAMPHRVHRVVPHVTMKRPVAGFRNKLYVARLSDADDFGGFSPPQRLRPAPAVRTGNPILHAVHVQWMIPHGQVAHAHPDAFARTGDQRVNVWKDLAVHGPQIKIHQYGRIGSVGAGVQAPVVQQKTVVAVNAHHLTILRVNDEHTHHAHRHLRYFISMRMIHVGAMLL